MWMVPLVYTLCSVILWQEKIMSFTRAVEGSSFLLTYVSRTLLILFMFTV